MLAYPPPDAGGDKVTGAVSTGQHLVPHSARGSSWTRVRAL